MSKRAGSMSLAGRLPKRRWALDEVDWKCFETKASNEVCSPEAVCFTEAAKVGIVNALNMFEEQRVIYDDPRAKKPGSNSTSEGELKIARLQVHTREIIAALADCDPRNEAEALEALNSFVFTRPVVTERANTLPIWEQVLSYALGNTLRMEGEPIVRRLREFGRLLKISPKGVTNQIPRPEAMAAHLIQSWFLRCGMSASVGHTRPTSSAEGREYISAFEVFVFEHVMPEIGSDPAARKTLQRRLEEAEKQLNLVRRANSKY